MTCLWGVSASLMDFQRNSIQQLSFQTEYKKLLWLLNLPYTANHNQQWRCQTSFCFLWNKSLLFGNQQHLSVFWVIVISIPKGKFNIVAVWIDDILFKIADNKLCCCIVVVWNSNFLSNRTFSFNDSYFSIYSNPLETKCVAVML